MNIEDEVAVLEAISTRRAIAFIGSGPSCEMQYATWKQMTEEVGRLVLAKRPDFNKKSFDDAVNAGRYPEALGFAQQATSRKFVCQNVESILKAGGSGPDRLYKALVQLPFSCYLTTNFDDEIVSHLKAAGRMFVVAQNEKGDFSSFRDDMKDVVYKIHGDMQHPDSVVLTSDDYSAFSCSPERAYFRARMQMLFGMKRCVLIGYSLADRDLALVLEGLKHVSSELSPAYIFLPDPDPLTSQEYSRLYGIHIIPYRVKDGSHSALCQKMETYVSILKHSTTVSTRTTADSKKAAGLYMFRSLKMQSDELDLTNYVLMSVPGSEGKGLSEADILSHCAIVQSERLHEALARLEKKLLVVNVKGLYNRTKDGDDLVDEAQMAFSNEKKFAVEQFLEQLTVPFEDSEPFVALLHECLASIFEHRGDALVRSVFERSNYSGGAVVDIYKAILPYAQKVNPPELCGVFVRAVCDFIIRPTSHQRAYLVALAQGYFLYHMMGKESQHKGMLQDAFQHSVWYVDSNLLIPLAAIGCANNNYAREMFSQIRKLDLRMIVVPSVLEEVRRHLKWAEEHDPDRKNGDVVWAVLNSKQQNLFVDGYVRLHAEGRVKSFRQYKAAVEVLLYKNASNLMRTYGFKYENPRLCASWNVDEFNRIKESLESRRRKTASFRRYFQVETDAELLYAMRLRIAKNKADANGDSVRFFSQSTLFCDEEPEVKTWSGEAMYRFLQFASPVMASEETLQECLQNELYNAGIEFVDKEKYADFFKEEIDMAELTFKEQREEFRRFLNEPDADAFQKKFENLSDLQKPIFIRQMEEKRTLIDSARINELQALLAESRQVEALATEKTEQAESEIHALKEELRKKTAALHAKEGEVRNLKNGVTYKRLLRKHRGKKK